MTREEIINSQDYKAEGVALDWYKSLSAENVGEIHITDAYADGVIYGWNNPQWIPVEDELPKVSGDYIICEKRGFVKEAHYFELDDLWMLPGGALVSPTHWMPKPVPPRKEVKNDKERNRTTIR